MGLDIKAASDSESDGKSDMQKRITTRRTNATTRLIGYKREYLLQSGNPIKRSKMVEFGNAKIDVLTDESGEHVSRGDSDKLMDPAISLNDSYYWVRSDEQSDHDVLDLVKQMNSDYDQIYTNDSLSNLTDQIFNDMKKYVVDEEAMYPRKFYDTVYYDYTRVETEKGHPIYCRASTANKDSERILLDVNEFVKTVENPDTCDVMGVTTSRDCKYLSYAVDLTGDEKYDLVLMKFDGTSYSKLVHHKIPQIIYGSYEWSPDSKAIFYIGSDKANRMHQVWVYDLESQESMRLIEDGDLLFSLGFSISKSSNYVIITSASLDTTKVWICKIDESRNYLLPTSYNVVRPKRDGIQYYVDTVVYDLHTSGLCDSATTTEVLVIRTNDEDCTNFKIVTANLENPSEWRDLIGHSDDVYIESIDTVKNYILIDYRYNGYSRAGYYCMTNSIKNMITPLGIDATLVNSEDNIDSMPSTISFADESNKCHNSTKIHVTYTSYIHSSQLIEIDLISKSARVVWQKNVPNFDSTEYATIILHVPSSTDSNIMIPVSVTYKKTTLDPKNPQPRPMLLCGYGAYGENCDPSLDRKIIPLLDRSFIYCVAHVRGSSAKGYRWYTTGKMESKQNTFTDFIDCAKYLIYHNYTHNDLLSIEGYSAGGLLMGAVLTQAPQMFNTVILGVPFVDILVTMRDGTIPLTSDEWIEWGNPNYEDHYEIMKAYSPMDNLMKVNYPHTYISCGLTDPRVQYWGPVKFQLKLLDRCTDDNCHLIKIDTNKGHFSNTDRYAELMEYARQYAFVVYNTQVEIDQGSS